MSDSKHTANCINRIYKGRKDYFIVLSGSSIYILLGDYESYVAKNEIKPPNIKVTVSMFIEDKLIIAGKFFDE